MSETTQTTNYTQEDVKNEVKPLNSNAFLAFFQGIWRKWLAFWYAFSDDHPKLSKLIYQIVMFLIICNGVTILQLIIFAFMPHLLGIEMAGTQWLWPGIEIPFYTEGGPWYFYLLGSLVMYESGEVVIGGGLGFFIAFAVGTFLAQCINFPLQRNVTFKSHGKVSIQIIWYFIGWVLVNMFCMGLESLWKPLANGALAGVSVPAALQLIISTVVMGGVSMVIFFLIFLVIFPDYATVAARAEKKLNSAKEANAGASVIAKLEAIYADAKAKAEYTAAEKAVGQTKTQSSGKAVAYIASIAHLAKLEAKLASASEDKKAGIQSEIDEATVAIDHHFAEACKAIEAKVTAQTAFDELKTA